MQQQSYKNCNAVVLEAVVVGIEVVAVVVTDVVDMVVDALQAVLMRLWSWLGLWH